MEIIIIIFSLLGGRWGMDGRDSLDGRRGQWKVGKNSF